MRGEPLATLNDMSRKVIRRRDTPAARVLALIDFD
jgi:hypothetical protein